MKCFIAVEGFQLPDSGKFIFKEISVMDETANCIQTWVFQPPYPKYALQFIDTLTIRKKSKTLQLKWEDGMSPYKSIPLIFEQLGSEFMEWIVQDRKTLERIRPFKSLNVSLYEFESREAGICMKRRRICPMTCIYNHPNCTLGTVTILYKDHKRA